MADLLHTIGEALGAYWSSPLSLTVVAVFVACMGTLLYVFLTNARNAKLRVSLLTGLYGMSIFFWAFVATSILLCIGQAGAVAGGLATSAIISLIVWRFGNSAVLRRFSPREPHVEERWIQRFVDLLG